MKSISTEDIIFCRIEEDFYNIDHGYININEISQITFIRTKNINYFIHPMKCLSDCLGKSEEYQKNKKEEFEKIKIFMTQLYNSDDFYTRIILLIPRIKKDYIILTKECSKLFWDQLTNYLKTKG